MNKKVDLCFHATLPQSPIYFTLFIELLTFLKSIPISLPSPLGHYIESKNNCKIIKNNWNSHDYILSWITHSTKNNSRFNPRNNTFHDEILSLKTRQEIHLISLWQTKWHGQMFWKIMKGQVAWQNEKVGCCKFQLLLARQIFQFYILPI